MLVSRLRGLRSNIKLFYTIANLICIWLRIHSYIHSLYTRSLRLDKHGDTHNCSTHSGKHAHTLVLIDTLLVYAGLWCMRGNRPIRWHEFTYLREIMYYGRPGPIAYRSQTSRWSDESRISLFAFSYLTQPLLSTTTPQTSRAEPVWILRKLWLSLARGWWHSSQRGA